MLEGLIGCLLIPINFFIDSTMYEDINSLKSNNNFGLLIFLLIIYFILTYFKNIYRVLTIKIYSPMTRALAESIVDPFDNIAQSLIKAEDFEKTIINRILYYFLIPACLFVIFFLSLVYNDFIGLEYNTHLEIHIRSISYENLNSGIMDDDNDNADEEINDKRELLEQK